MATCYECLHNEACSDIGEAGISHLKDGEEKCDHFKNKADFEEVKHGEWKKRGNEKECSACKFIYYSNNDEFNFCPNCGAKMDGGRKNDL